MNPKLSFSTGKVVLLVLCAFVWGGQTVNYLTGNASLVSAVLTSISSLCVIVVVFLSARGKPSEIHSQHN
jgi:hypothetical protein